MLKEKKNLRNACLKYLYSSFAKLDILNRILIKILINLLLLLIYLILIGKAFFKKRHISIYYFKYYFAYFCIPDRSVGFEYNFDVFNFRDSSRQTNNLYSEFSCLKNKILIYKRKTLPRFSRGVEQT